MFAHLNEVSEDGPRTSKECSSYNDLHHAPVLQCGRRSSSAFVGGKDDAARVHCENNDCMPCGTSRLPGGTHRHYAANKIFSSLSQCKLQPAGLQYFDPKNQVSVVNLQLSDVRTKSSADGLKLPQRQTNDVKKRTRATQTLFRESSVQTLPYLPAVSNDPAELDTLEIFKLPTILSGNKPPGLYEVEVLERARKRWRFAKALKENFRQQLKTAREQAKLQKHEHILQAFEWEHWIEREENIQECQMLRLELLIRMFDKRERDMHIASKARIQKSCQDIEAKRNAALKKNEVEYNRDIRRLNLQHSKQPRYWRKGSITQELADPSSEFYAPQMRYGVNPNRRHYAPPRNDFDKRMYNLEKKAILMDPKSLKCPFTKLRKWSKPKEVLQEVEQNFCLDANLNKLYDSLRSLREPSQKVRYTPLCLKTKKPQTLDQKQESMELNETIVPDGSSQNKQIFGVTESSISVEYTKASLANPRPASLRTVDTKVEQPRCEELESLIGSYQGSTIGWLMRFLTEEMTRLKELRKLQLLTMLTKRKRWRGEAAEAGLRQKENYMRGTYEKIYDECIEVNEKTTQGFLDSILKTDIMDYAKQKAEQDVIVLAKDLDKEISDWLKSFKEVQNPLNYHSLRQALKDIVMPNAENVLYNLERDECIEHIINDVIMAKVYHNLEPYDVSFTLVNDLVDRLIDNDIFLNSSDSSSDFECLSQQEAKAIIRKIIRRTVPGRRWLTEEERVNVENVRDLLDDVFNKVIKEDGIIEIDMKGEARTSCGGAHIDLIYDNRRSKIEELFGSPLPADRKEEIKFKFFNRGSKANADNITKSLRWNEKLLLTDPDQLPSEDYLMQKCKYVMPETAPKLSIVHNIPSYHDLSSIEVFHKTPTFAQTSSDELLERLCLELEEEMGEESFMPNEASDEDLGFVEQLGCEEQPEEQPEEHHQEEPKQGELQPETNKDYAEEEEPQGEGVSTQDTPQLTNVSENSTQKLQKQLTVQISNKIIVENFGAESIAEEDDSSSFMRVSFTYDPQLKFSVAIPTNEDDLEAGQ